MTSTYDKDERATGLSYALPKAVIRGKLMVDPASAAFVMCLLAAPIPIADPQQQFYMPFNNNPFSADTYEISKDDTTGALKKIDVKTIDRFNEFAVNLARSAAALQRALNPEGGQLDKSICKATSGDYFVLATFDIDPADERSVRDNMDAVNGTLLIYATRKATRCRTRGLPFNESIPEEVITAEEACEEYKRIAKTYNRHNPPIRMQWQLPYAPSAPPPNCTVGFCYRHTLPHTVQIAMAGSSVHSYTYQIPNASPIVSMDITRAITVTKTTSVEFGTLGQITKIKMQKGKDDGSVGSEAEGLALIPYNMVTAYFGALKSTSDLIASAFTSEKSQYENMAARDKAYHDAKVQARALAQQEGGELQAAEEFAVAASNGLNATKPKSIAFVAPKVKDQDGGSAAEKAAAEKAAAEKAAADKLAAEKAKVGANPPAIVTPVKPPSGPTGPGTSPTK